MATFSVLILTAAPAGQAAEAGGAFVKIDGRECLLRSVELFLNRNNIKQIQLAVLPEEQEEAKRKYGGHLGFSGVKMIAAGPKWIDQIAAAADKISDECTHVIVHDAARPAVAFSDIDALLAEAEKHPAAVLTSPLRASLVEVDEGAAPVAWHLPTRFVQLLTPQAYSREKFLEMAKTRAELHPSQVTLVKGSPLNLRVAGPGDASLVKAMINMLPKPKVRGPENPFEEAQW